MRVLLHVCCAPCACLPLLALREEGLEVMGLFYNPNIHPYTENRRRRETAETWAQGERLKLIVQDAYDPEAWMRRVAFREAQRCRLCYADRLEAAAGMAQKGGFDAFTSSLLYSVRQKHDLIRETGEAAAAAHGVKFLYRDFRPLWRQGVARSKELGLYRQPYCGCLFSERDRYFRAGGRRAEDCNQKAGERSHGRT
ncbi:MAG: epoxyqueuosine reductase QueH [Deltaproteobacteria bacterium]|nr:epoxyqueuosine reductase QueH [Deltaproteobacteria bacterium]